MEFFTPNKGDTGITIVLDVTNSMTEALDAMVGGLAHYVVQRVAQEDEWSEVTRLSLVLFDDHYRYEDGVGIRHTYQYNGVKRRFLSHPDDKHLVTDAIRLAGTTDNLEEYIYWLKTAKAVAGADDPEAIACALLTARMLDPVSRIWLVTDSLAHGMGWQKGYGGDYFPSGCPCGVPLDLTNVSIIGDPDIWDQYLAAEERAKVVGDIISLTEVVRHLETLSPTEVEEEVAV